MDWLSVLIGGAITLVVYVVFYGLAARDLKQEAKALRERTLELEDAIERTKHHIISLGESLEEAGTTKLTQQGFCRIAPRTSVALLIELSAV